LVLDPGEGRLTSGKTVYFVVVIIAVIAVTATLAFFDPSLGRTVTTTSSFSSSTTSATPSRTSVVPIVNVAIPNGSGLQKGSPYYLPNAITVVIGVNNTVVWTNNDTEFGGVIHTVTANNKAFDSKNMNAGDTFKWTFSTPGTYSYYCIYHAWMTGTVTVKSG